MGALSFWYVWVTGIRKKLIILAFKKRKIFRVASNWQIFSFIFGGVANFKFNFLSHSLINFKNSCAYPGANSLNFLKHRSFLNFDVFECSYARNKENLHFRKWANLSHPRKSPFFLNENYHLFSYSYVSKVPKWKCAHILLCKKVQKLLT